MDAIALVGAPAFAALWLAGTCLAAASPEEPNGGATGIHQDVETAGRGTGASSALPLPPPGPESAVVEEVIGSLKIMNQEHNARVASVPMPGLAQRISRPFPDAPYLVFSPRVVAAPYDLWTFEIVEQNGDILWRQDGTEKVMEPLEWDGSGPAGEDAVRLGHTYFFRFTGRRGPQSFLLTSEPVKLKSLALKEYLGGTRLEVANGELFASQSAALTADAAKYLRPIADRLRRFEIKGAYTLELHQREPEGALAKKRAAALRKWLAEALLVNTARVQVKRLTAGRRGEITSCLLPADTGDRIHTE